MWFNVKGVFVLAACVVFGIRAWPFLAAGFFIPTALAAGWLASEGAWAGYVDQVWRWGLTYATSPDSIANGWFRLVNWLGFHAALILGAAWCWWKGQPGRARWLAWFAISLISAGVGWRFLPRYMDQLLPPLLIPASYGLARLWEQRSQVASVALVASLAVPLLRFGPRYLILAREQLTGTPHTWSDAAMDQDSLAAARVIEGLTRPGDTILIWGYRPDVIAYTRLPIASRFWDSQPLTGVPADRHLSSEVAIAPSAAAAHRAELIRSRPTFIADGLSLYNPRLDIHKFADLTEWFAQYCEVGRTQGTIVYRRCGAAR